MHRFAVILAVVGLGSTGCNAILGTDDHQLAPTGASAPEGGIAAEGGSSRPSDTVDGGTGPVNGAETGVPTPGSEAGTEDGGPVDAGICSAGALQCSGGTPQLCVAGAWQDQAACGGATPVCSNGLCGTYRTTGGVVSTAVAPASGAGVHLVSGGFEVGGRTCDDAGVCVTGGIVP